MEYYHYVMVGTASLLTLLGWASSAAVFFYRVKQLEKRLAGVEVDLRKAGQVNNDVRRSVATIGNDVEWIKTNLRRAKNDRR